MSGRGEGETMTHKEGVELARVWLARRHGRGAACPVVVVTELTHGLKETPDAIGWHGTSSTVVEVKASRADFRSDAQKLFRRDSTFGMGDERYYLAPAGLIQPEELPEGWGLIEVHGSDKLRVAVRSGWFQEKQHQSETSLLLSVIRRIGQHAPDCVSIRCYTTDTKKRATLTVANLKTEGKDDGEEEGGEG